MNILLTKSTTPIIGWIAEVLGYIISGIYWCLEKIGFPNIGLAIILFTFVMYLLMTPLQFKQQKFSKMNSIMMPEIKKIQDKYKNKRDQQSQMKMQEETQAVYEKYGVSPTGSCVQMLITLPVMFALYQIIYRIPGYIASVRGIFEGLVTKITSVNGFTDIINTFIEENKVTNLVLQMENGVATNNGIIDFLYKLTPSQWDALGEVPAFSSFASLIDSTQANIEGISMFAKLNIADNPMSIIKNGFTSGNYLIMVIAILIPILAWFTQWMNYKLMPQSKTGDNMDQTMKSMNTMMPLMSAFFCITFSVGIGLYWIAGAVFRSIQQVIMNKHMEKIDIDELIKENQEKAKAKRAKKGLPDQKITQQATQNARRINDINKGVSAQEREAAIKKATEYYNSGKAGSIASKANMVKQYDEKNKK